MMVEEELKSKYVRICEKRHSNLDIIFVYDFWYCI